MPIDFLLKYFIKLYTRSLMCLYFIFNSILLLLSFLDNFYVVLFIMIIFLRKKYCTSFCYLIYYLCYLSYVPPTQECGTRPFLRWVRSQGRSPHASGKAQNTFGPVGIPLIRGSSGARQWTQSPKWGKNLEGWPPEAGGTLQCRGTPGRTTQRYDGLPNATPQLERKELTRPLVYHLLSRPFIYSKYIFKKNFFRLL